MHQVIGKLLHYKEIGKTQERISELKHYEDQYNLNGVEFLLAIQKIGKTEKKNLDITANVIFSRKKGIDTQLKNQKLMEGPLSKTTYRMGKIDITWQSKDCPGCLSV